MRFTHRWFWLSWKDGLIAFGKGIEVGRELVLSWQDDDNGHDVQSIGMTSAMNQKAYFGFMEIKGTVVNLCIM